MEKVAKKLAFWKKSYRLLGGRITLIKVSLANIPIYYMSLFKLLCKVTKKLQKFQRDFSSEGKKIIW